MNLVAGNEMGLGSEVVMLIGGRGQALVRTAGSKGASMYIDVLYRGGVGLWATHNNNNPLPPSSTTTTTTHHGRDALSSFTTLLESVLQHPTSPTHITANLPVSSSAASSPPTTTMSQMKVVSSPELSPFPVSDMAVLIASKTPPCAAVGVTLGSLRNSLSFNNKKKQMKEKGKHNITHTVFIFDHTNGEGASGATEVVRLLKPVAVQLHGKDGGFKVPQGFLEQCASVTTPPDLRTLCFLSFAAPPLSPQMATHTNHITMKTAAAVPPMFLSRCSIGPSINLSPLLHVSILGDGFLHSCDRLVTLDLSPLCNVHTVGSSFLGGCTGLTGVIDLAPLTINVISIGDYFMYLCNKASFDLELLSGVVGYPTFYRPSFVETPYSCIHNGDIGVRTIPTPHVQQ